MLTRIIVSIAMLGTASVVHAQALPAGERAGDFKIGGGFSTANSDYGDRYNGGGAYFNYDFLPHIGVEGDFHFVNDVLYAIFYSYYEKCV